MGKEMKKSYFIGFVLLEATLLFGDGPVLKTGQTAVIKAGDDGTYQTGIMRSYSSVDGVVTDHATGLQWQDDYSDNGGEIKTENWNNAKVYCESLPLNGGGWRLPSSRELVSVTDKTRTYPSIDTTKFKAENVKSDFYWSSTIDVRHFNNAWSVSFGISDQFYKVMTDIYSVRCVRNIL